jgi:PAS domain S-box-containing protein
MKLASSSTADQLRLARSARDGILVIQDGRIVFTNLLAGRISGFRTADLLGMPPLRQVHPEDVPRVRREWDRVLEGRGGRRPLVMRIRNCRGATRWLELSAALRPWESRPAVVCFLTDVTAREESLRWAARAEREMSALLNGLTTVGVEYIDRAMRIVWANACSLAQAGLEPAKAVGQLCYQARRGLDAPCPGCLAVRALATGAFQQGEITRENGRTYLVQSNPVRDDDGRIIGAVNADLDITATRAMEAALMEQKDLLRSTLEATADGILALTTDGKVLTWNSRMIEMWRLPPETLHPGARDADLVPRVLPQLKEPTAFLALVNQETRATDFLLDEIHFTDGRVYERSNRPLLRHGRLAGRVISFRDISGRKAAEEALQASEARYRTLYRNIPVGLFRTTPRGRLVSANPAFLRMFGYETEACLQKAAVSALYREPRDREAFIGALDRDGEVAAMEIAFLRRDGTAFWGAISARKVLDETGDFIYVDGILEDITARRRMAGALRESERRFRHLVENVPFGMCILREDGHPVFVNPAQARLVGRTAEGRNAVTAPIHPDDREKFQAAWRDVLKAGEGAQNDMEVRLAPPAGADPYGEPQWIHCNFNRLIYDDAPGVLITAVDVTRAKDLERRIAVQDKMASLGHVAAGIAHEIRNPLSGINVLLDGIQDHFEDPARAADIRLLLAEARKASEKIAAVIKRVMDFTRPSPLRLAQVHINQPLREALQLFRTTLPHSAVTLEADLDDDIPLLYADSQLIEQVALNLLSNAMAALAGGREPRRIRLSSRRDGPHALVSVADSGPGVPPGLRERVFTPFFTTRASGSGIGLSLCQRIVADHGGRIEIGTSEWGGAALRVRLPLEKRALTR